MIYHSLEHILKEVIMFDEESIFIQLLQKEITRMERMGPIRKWVYDLFNPWQYAMQLSVYKQTLSRKTRGQR